MPGDFAVLVNFAVLMTPFASDLTDMWMRQHCKVQFVVQANSIQSRSASTRSGASSV